jgi:hypothetical protein
MRLEVRIKNRSREGLRSGCPQLPDLIHKGLRDWESGGDVDANA